MKLKKLFSNLPLNRLIVYLIILGFAPASGVLFYITQEQKEWKAISERMLTIHSLSEAKARKQHLNTLVRSTYSETDQFYIENQLEPLSFLKKERETLEQLLLNPTFTGNEAAEKRFSFVSSNANRFEFTHGNSQTAEGIQESLYMLAHPVEIDSQDIKEILMRIEGNRKGKPQLIITDFNLHKKTHFTGNEVFELNMKLLKREYPA